MKLFLVVLIAVAACGGDSPCEAFGKQLCDKACSCSDECGLIFGDTRLTFDEERTCRSFYVTLGCQNEDAEDFDYEGCSTALDESACGMTTTGQVGFVYPDGPACD